MNSTVYNGSLTEFTGAGLAGVELNGTATTFWGLTCTLSGPFDTIVVN